MDDYQLTSTSNNVSTITCGHCGQRQDVARATIQGQQHLINTTVTRLREIATEQSNVIEALRQEMHDREERNNAIMVHYEQLNRLEKGLARESEEAERKAETEIGVLTEELERLQSLLTAHGIAF